MSKPDKTPICDTYKWLLGSDGIRFECVPLTVAQKLERGLTKARAEVEALKHDIERHIAITSEQATELTECQASLTTAYMTGQHDGVEKVQLAVVEWKPTHRHADGGLYKCTGITKVKVGITWLEFVGYVSADGHHYARLPDDFHERMKPISVADKLKANPQPAVAERRSGTGKLTYDKDTKTIMRDKKVGLDISADEADVFAAAPLPPDDKGP